MSDKINHRRKNKRTHNAHFAWVSSKRFRRTEWGKFRADERDCMKTERYDDLPETMLPTAWYCVLWH